MPVITRLTSFLNISGYSLPCPRYELEYTITTVVDAGRNLNAAIVGAESGERPVQNKQFTVDNERSGNNKAVLTCLIYRITFRFQHYSLTLC